MWQILQPRAVGSSPAEEALSSQSEDQDENQTVMLKWIQIGSIPQDLDTVVAKMNEYSIEKIGVGIDLQVFDWGDWEAGITNMLNTGESFDIAFIHTSHYISHAAKFYDLTDHLDSVAPELKNFIPEAVWKGVMVNGKVLGVPTYKDSSSTEYLAWSKQTVDEYGIDYQNIETYQQWGDALRKIKQAKQAETGQNVYPLQLVGGSGDGVSEIRMYYDNYVKYDDQTATVSNFWKDEAVVEKLKFLHEWYEEGLINPDAATLAQASNIRDCFTAQGFVGAQANWSQQYGHEYVIHEFSPSIMSTNTILGSVNVISANSPYPEQAMKYLQLVNTDQTLRDMYAYGMQGIHFEYTDHGTVKRLTDTWTLPSYSQASYFSMTPVDPNPKDQWDNVRIQTENASQHVLLGFTLDESLISDELANVNAVWLRERGELTTGAYQGSTEQKLEKFIKDLEDAGLQKVLDETQKQINQWKNQ